MRQSERLVNYSVAKGLKQGIIKLSGTSITFPSQVSPEQLCQVRIVPKCDSYVIEVIYAIEDFPQSASNKIASIALGLNNLAALTSNLVGFVPILVNGRYLKSVNQFFIPTYGEETETPRFSGRRVKRGLYKISSGTVYNADVNGSYNILRKAFPNAFKEKGIESCVVQPRRIVAL